MLLPARRRLFAGAADTSVVTFAGIVTAVHLAVYAATAGSPVGSARPHWDGWWDQGHYLRSATAFAEGNLSPDQHWYALGYPLLGAPFLTLLPRDPFFIVDTVSVVVLALACLAYFRPSAGAVPTMAAFLAAQLLPVSIDVPHRVVFPVWAQYVIPWNTAPVAALLMVILVVVRGLRAGDAPIRDAWLGALVGTVVAIRPSDALPLLVAGAFYAHRRLVRERAFAHVGAALAALAVVLGSYAGLSWLIYGGLATPYHDQVRLIGASLSDIHERVYSIVFDASATHGETAAALASLQPWLLLAIPLALAWILTTGESATLVVGTAAVSLLSYISFNDFWPYAILRLSLLHYIAWTLPVLTCAGVAGAVDLIRLRRWTAFAAALASAALLASLRLTPVPVPIDHLIVKEQANGHTRYELTFDRSHDVDAIDFAGAMAVDPRAVTMQSFAITEDGHQLALYRGYRPIQLDGAFRIIFNRHIDAARIEVTLDRTVGNHPVKLPQVSAITFSLTLAPFASNGRS